MTEITIILATYNGEQFLLEQLESYTAQIDVNWRLIVSDDGSTDATRTIIEGFAAANPGRVELHNGPRQGASKNFLFLLTLIPNSSEFVAFSDQDDVWLPHKLKQALNFLTIFPPEQPSLYCSRTHIVDENLKSKGLSQRVRRRPSFRNAIVQNIAGGNTIVINRSSIDLLRAALSEVNLIVFHDWWVYQVISGVSGNIIHDDTPGLMYRQHDKNVIGSNSDLISKIARVRMLIRGDYSRWNRLNVAALMPLSERFTPSNRHTLRAFDYALKSPRLFGRLCALWKARVYRQSNISNIALWISVFLNKI